MKLANLLAEIDQAGGPVTGVELGRRLGVDPAEVRAMLAALRASGRLVPDGTTEAPPGDCGSAGSCALSCPGPDKCGLVIDLHMSALEVR